MSSKHTTLILAVIAVACGAPQDERSTAVETSGAATAMAPAEPSAEAGAPVRGDWLVSWLLADPESLNPLTSNDSASSTVLSWIYSPLLTLDPETLEQRPVVAAALPLVSEDKLTYTFKLRDDVTFSDGVAFSAEDVVFTVKATKHPKVNAPHARNYFESVRDVVAVDPLTVRFDLKTPYFRNHLVLGSIQPLPRHHYDPEGRLADVSVAELADLDALPAEKRARVEAFAKDFNANYHRNPLGPGAFVLRDPEEDLVTGEKIVLRRRSDFWAPDDPDFGDAWVDRIFFRVINDREAALVGLKNGDLDTIGMTPLQYRINKDNPNFTKAIATKIHVSPGFSYIGWNQKRPLFQQKELRRALSHFVDKQNLVDKVLHGLAVPVESPIFVERPEYNQSLEPYRFDPELGKRMLDSAGWTDTDGDGVRDRVVGETRVPLRIEIISNSGNDIRRDVGLAVIDEMKKAGIDASFRAMDWSIMLEKVRKYEYDAVILGWAMSVVVPDAYQIWHSSQIGGSNHVAFNDPEVDEILEKYRVEFDPAKRKLMYDRFQEIIYDEQPYTFLFMQRAITAWDRRFEGVAWYPSGGTDLNEWWVPEARRKYQ